MSDLRVEQVQWLVSRVRTRIGRVEKWEYQWIQQTTDPHYHKGGKNSSVEMPAII